MTMTKLPTAYAWLAQEPGPKMLVEALRLYGTTEKAGPSNNPSILAWAQECGIPGYGADAIPWCGLFVAICAHRAGKALPMNPLWARDWAAWGAPASRPALGDVLVFRRDGGGHVGLYVGEDGLAYHVLGGNQGDAVSIRRIAKNRLIAARRGYAIAPPANVRAIRLAASGSLSTQET
jgi:uncharacterized protein (TIGR02594 family)